MTLDGLATGIETDPSISDNNLNSRGLEWTVVVELEHPVPLQKVIRLAKKSLDRICLAVVSGE
jgi:hypothetical protein